MAKKKESKSTDIFVVDSLTPAQVKFFDRFVQHLDMRKAAKEAGIDSRVLFKWCNTAAFMENINKVRKCAMEVLQADGALAMQKLIDTQEDLRNLLHEQPAVASALVKTHELEMRAAGSFSKDNEQKAPQVIFNIDLGQTRKVIEGVVEDLGLVDEQK